MVTQNILSTHEEKRSFRKKNLICDYARSTLIPYPVQIRAYLFLSYHLIQMPWYLSAIPSVIMRRPLRTNISFIVIEPNIINFYVFAMFHLTFTFYFITEQVDIKICFTTSLFGSPRLVVYWAVPRFPKCPLGSPMRPRGPRFNANGVCGANNPWSDVWFGGCDPSRFRSTGGGQVGACNSFYCCTGDKLPFARHFPF